MKNTGRDAYSKDYCRYASNWIDCPNEPLYPFGYGLLTSAASRYLSATLPFLPVFRM